MNKKSAVDASGTAARIGLHSVVMFLCAAFISVSIMMGSVAFATEGGGGAYPNGSEDFMSGAIPPPGFYFINYAQYYWADKFKDGNGNNAIPGFKAKVAVDALRFIYVTKVKVLDANWLMHTIIPVVNVDVNLPVGKKSWTGIGDVVFDPFALSWHFSKNLHAVAGVDIFMPVGDYDKTRIANPGRDYWTFEPLVGVTYLSDSGIELSSKFMYDFNTKNGDTDYLSGQEFHFDYTVGYHINNWSLGLGGYYYKQVTDDKQNGIAVMGPDGTAGFKGQAFAIGPQVKYDYKNMSFILKYQKEMAVENRPEGDKAWFKFIYAF